MDTMQAHLLILAINNLTRAVAVLPSDKAELQRSILETVDNIEKMADDYLESLHSSEMGD